MKKSWARFFGNECEHRQTVTVSSVGVERTVCEKCGNVSFSIAPSLVLSSELTTPRYDESLDLPKAG